MRSGIFGYLFYSQVFPGIFGYFRLYWISSVFLEVLSQILSFFLTSIEAYPIPSHVWEYSKYRVIPETSGLPEISGNTRYFRLPAT